MQSFSKGILLIIFFLVITSVILFVKEQTKKKKKNNDKNNGSSTINDKILTRRNLGAGDDRSYYIRFVFTTPTSYGDDGNVYGGTLFYIADNPQGSQQPTENPTLAQLQDQTYYKGTGLPFIPESFISDGGQSARPPGTQLTVDVDTFNILTNGAAFLPAANPRPSYYLGIAVANNKTTAAGLPVFGPFTYTTIQYTDPTPPPAVPPFTASLDLN